MRSTNIVIILISTIVLIGGLVWFATSRQQSSTTTSSVSSRQHVVTQAKAPEAVFTNLQGNSIKLSSFKGKKVMLWLVATWCSSCIEGAKVLVQNKNKLSNLTIITLKTYGNAGYPGPSIKKFASKMSSTVLPNNWHWGNLTQQSTQVYNSRNYPDIYFLIDKNDVVREISDAPAATIGDILKFARN